MSTTPIFSSLNLVQLLSEVQESINEKKMTLETQEYIWDILTSKVDKEMLKCLFTGFWFRQNLPETVGDSVAAAAAADKSAESLNNMVEQLKISNNKKVAELSNFMDNQRMAGNLLDEPSPEEIEALRSRLPNTQVSGDYILENPYKVSDSGFAYFG